MYAYFFVSLLCTSFAGDPDVREVEMGDPPRKISLEIKLSCRGAQERQRKGVEIMKKLKQFLHKLEDLPKLIADGLESTSLAEKIVKIDKDIDVLTEDLANGTKNEKGPRKIIFYSQSSRQKITLINAIIILNLF